MPKRIRFTRAELDAIINMAAIASAMGQSEGDYQEWTDGTFDAAARAAEKAWDLIHKLDARKGGSSAA